MLKLALCDDETQQRDVLSGLLREYAAARPSLAVKLSVFSSGQELLAAVHAGGPFDLYLLDVLMPGLSGINLGVRLREMDAGCTIIYLSVSPEYAVDSYQARAFYYLMKPARAEQLYQVLDQAVAERKKRQDACIAVKTRDGLQLVRLDEVLYAELANRTVRYHLAGGGQVDSVTVRVPFQEAIAPLLADSRFFLCGVSFAANLFYVTAVERNHFLLDGGERVPLSRGLSVRAKERWREYWLGEDSP